MSYENGIISIKTVGGVTYGVAISDVQRALGRGVSDLGLLCSDQEWYADPNTGTQALRRVYKIKGWAKYKPVRSSLLAVLSDADRQDAYFGMSIPIYGTGFITEKGSFLTAYNSGWTYLPPRGKTTYNEWFRLRDFEGYNINANCFFFLDGCTFPEEYVWGQSNAAGCTWSLGLHTSAADLKGGIAVSDLKLGGHSGTAFSSLFFGLLFVNGNTYKIVTSSSSLANGGRDVNIPEPNNDGLQGLDRSATYTVYPILSLAARTTVTDLGNTSTDTVVGLPAAPFEFRQTSEASQLVLITRNTSAVFDELARLYVYCEVGMRSTGSVHSIQTVNYTIKTATASGDQTGTLLGSGSVGPIDSTVPTFAAINRNFRPSGQPNRVWIHLEAYGHTGVTKDIYPVVTDGNVPVPSPIV